MECTEVFTFCNRTDSSQVEGVETDARNRYRLTHQADKIRPYELTIWQSA